MKRHRFDPFSFLFGALFLVVGGTFLFGGSGLEVARPERMWAAATVVIGVSLAVWAVARTIRKEPSPTLAGNSGGQEVETSGADEIDRASATVAPDERPEEPSSP
ncbi:MAG: hypothetical protein ABI595_08100 [Actinomycetota bacterium]